MAERTFKDLKRETLHVPEPQTPKTPEAEPDVPSVVQLQRYLGNQGVQRLMKQGRLSLATGGVLQAKLSVTAAGDAYEQEADKMAQQVVNGQPNQAAVQRAGEEDELAMKRDFIQRAGEEDELAMKRTDPAGAFDVGGDLEQTIQAERGGGQAMPDQSRSFFENGFGQDFSGVRVHTDQTSDALNRSLSAKAFTVGSDIFFRSGEYNPEGQAGKELLAHELTHVVQQGGAKVQKKEDDK